MIRLADRDHVWWSGEATTGLEPVNIGLQTAEPNGANPLHDKDLGDRGAPALQSALQLAEEAWVPVAGEGHLT